MPRVIGNFLWCCVSLSAPNLREENSHVETSQKMKHVIELQHDATWCDCEKKQDGILHHIRLLDIINSYQSHYQDFCSPCFHFWGCGPHDGPMCSASDCSLWHLEGGREWLLVVADRMYNVAKVARLVQPSSQLTMLKPQMSDRWDLLILEHPYTTRVQ